MDTHNTREGDAAKRRKLIKQNNANVFIDTPPDFFNDDITVALGKNKEDKWFKNESMSYGKLLGYLTHFQRGPKNGSCMLQGALADGSAARLAVHQAVNYLMMVDVDNGMPLETIDATLAAHNLHATVYTTHSHGKGESEVSEKKMVAYQKEKKAERIDAALVAKFLLEEKGYNPEILVTVSNYRKLQRDGGVHCIIDHAPMPRFRIVFKLKTPYAFVTEEGTQQERINEWKEWYAGVCRALKIPYDTSCVDPSRLMFLPRIANDAVVRTGESPTSPEEDVVGGHGIYVFNGDELDLSLFERHRSTRSGRDDNNEFASFAALSPKREGQHTFVTANVTVFAAKYRDFQAGTCCNELAEGDEFAINKGEGKYEIPCPTDDLHTVPDAPGMSRFFVQDAIDGDGWVMHCQGDTCKRTSAGDRLWYFDQWCKAHGITDALDERILRYCPSWEEEQRAKKEVATAHSVKASPDIRAQLRLRIDGEIVALTKTTPENTLNTIYKALSMLTGGDDVLYVSTCVDRIYTNTTIAKSVIRNAIKTFIKERTTKERTQAKAAQNARASDAQEEEAVERGAANIAVPLSVETKAGAKLQISARWPIDDRRSVIVRRIKWTNAQRPHIFVKDGEIVRVIDVPSDPDYLKFKKMEKGDWEFELMETANFQKINAEGMPEEVMPFPECVNALMNTSTRDWPVISYVSTVPLFGSDGELRKTEGYHADIKAYIKPNIEALELPDVIDDATVTWARDRVIDAIIDFPFADSFDGSEVERIKHADHYDPAETEGRAVWRQNLKRGRGSRADAIAMMIQPHLRAVLTGQRPGYVISKTAAGTGAGALMDVVNIIAEGRPTQGRNVSTNDEEFRKLITTALLAQRAVIFLDNINHRLDSAALAGAMTSGEWGDRVLGTNTSADVKVDSMWVLAGNGLRMTRELMRRMVPVHMDADDPDPALSRGAAFFKYDPLEDHIMASRADYLQAIHILIKNWFNKGCPKGSGRMESFNVYAYSMSGILEAAGIDGFLGNRKAYMGTTSDDSLGAVHETVELLWEKFGDKPFNLDDAWDTLRNPVADLSGKDTLVVDILGKSRSAIVRNLSGLARVFGENGSFLGKNFTAGMDETGNKSTVKFVKCEHRPVKYQLRPVHR